MKRPKPRPGSLPLTRSDKPPPQERVESWWSVARRSGYTMSEAELQPLKDAFAEDRARREAEANFTGLQQARAKVLHRHLTR